MGKIESKVGRRSKRQKIQDIVLAGLYVAAATGMAAAAPNTLQLLKYVEGHVGPKQKLDRRISQAMTRLRAKGLVASNNKLTNAGTRRAAEASEWFKVRPRVPLRWDKKWRIIIFDIWEKRRDVRDQLRSILESSGFVRIQNSVWAYPYPCEELFTFLRASLRLGSGVLYIVAEEIENDRYLREHFGLV